MYSMCIQDCVSSSLFLYFAWTYTHFCLMAALIWKQCLYQSLKTHHFTTIQFCPWSVHALSEDPLQNIQDKHTDAHPPLTHTHNPCCTQRFSPKEQSRSWPQGSKACRWQDWDLLSEQNTNPTIVKLTSPPKKTALDPSNLLWTNIPCFTCHHCQREYGAVWSGWVYV